MKNILILTATLLGFITINSCSKDEPASNNSTTSTPSPVADFTYTGGGTAPCDVIFNNKSTNATSYEWEFGDGTTSKDKNPTKNYSNGGTYIVKLTSKNATGSSSKSTSITINQAAQTQLPTADFTISGSYFAPTTLTFTNTSTNATSYLWDFGDGSTSVETNPSHNYTTAGTYVVVLKSTNANGTSQSSKALILNKKLLPKPNFDYYQTPSTRICKFINFSTLADSYLWDFGDGTTSTETSPTHTYSIDGTFNVVLKATNADGTEQLSKSIEIKPIPTFTNVKITKVDVTNIPFTNSSGSIWDIDGSGPDVFMIITDQSATVLLENKSDRIEDVKQTSLPLSWTLTTPLLINNFNSIRNFDLLDFDPIGSNENIGKVSFLMSDYTSGSNPYPTTVTKTQNGITITLSLTWQ